MPETWKQPFQLGVKAFRESKHEDAIKHFTRSIELDNTNASVYDSRAAAYQCVSKLREALADTRRCISLQPDRYVGYYRSARIFLAMPKYDRCLQMVSEARRRMNASDASYIRKTQELDEMEATARRGLQAAETYRRNHVDLLKKLPLELLVDICKIAVDTSDGEAGPRGASYFVLTLGSVCRSLRDLVHRTPSFWQSVSFSEKRFARKSAFWLDRLDGHPLYSVALIGIGRHMIPQVLEFLSRTDPDSWRHLRIEGDTVDAHALHKALQGFAFSLYSFALVCPLSDDEPLVSPHTFYVSNALASLNPIPETSEPTTCTRSIILRVGTICPNFAALANVTHLDLGMARLTSSQYDMLDQILYAAPKLRSLIIKPQNLTRNMPSYTLEEIPQLEDPGSFCVEQLEILRLGTIGPVPNHLFAFPNLQVLDLQSLPRLSVATMFRYLLEGRTQQTCPPIRELRLNLIVLDSTTFKLALEAFSPTLESLEVSNCGVLNDDIMNCLSRPVPGTRDLALCPRLRDINFSGTGELTAGPLVRLIKAHLPNSNADNPNPPTPVRNLIIDNCPGINADALPWMRANVTGILSCVYKTKTEAKGRRKDRFL
ncbi:TPR-1 domain protein [Ceratobasidium sp. AG-Ba]|nr:TPR-1 domain protein [Ceratobasidium sp. AG-Ba]